jgi:Tol biopolymer transport system component
MKRAAYPGSVFRSAVIAAVVLLAFAAAASRASSSTISPCTAVRMPVWSPDGQQIAYYATRWPPPTTKHRNPNDILQALCTASADGTNAQPLRYTVCDSNCADPPYQLVWLQSGLLFLRDGDIFRITPGSKPKKIARIADFSFVTNTAGTRIAAGAGTPSCLSCSGPVTVLDAQSGARVGTVGGKKLDNVSPSLSPDGTKVVFQRDASDDSGKTFGIWTAKTDGSHLRQLAKVGQQPLWAPSGGKVAYVASAGNSVALRLISAGGGESRALVPRGVENVFGWSPDGKSIAFETGSGTFGKLAVVDVTNGKVRTLIKLRYSPAAIWKPDSSELLATSTAAAKTCPSLYRVPVDGSTPTMISSCPTS